MSTPFIAIGNDELGKPLKKGELIKCSKCKRHHAIECGIDKETKRETEALLFYQCGKTSYLAGIDGRAIR